MQDFREVFEIMEERGIGIREWFIYDSAASFYIAKGELLEANRVFLLGISRSPLCTIILIELLVN